MSLPRASRRCILFTGLATSSLIFACGCLWLNSGVRQTLPEPQANLNRGLAMTIENLPGEEWLPVVGWESFYEVSNMGRVRNLPRVCWNGKVEWLMHSKIMKTSDNGKGYRSITLNSGRKAVKILYVHRLVAFAFVQNDDAENKIAINHIDGVKHNNRADNIEWVTYAQNSRHAIDKQLKKTKRVRRTSQDGIVSEFIDVHHVAQVLGVSMASIYSRIHDPRLKGDTWEYIS